ncbi:hypothetical protein NPIL_560241 [Nephila pilipes]|uniref:Uncharacterized protein n=1 Tax=Nephila pilipes TaxID=299642 RepID=A0A8X6MDI2_NEPPI|nr:hypothetical protein NPIL_560241 [Nephila pilipes]
MDVARTSTAEGHREVWVPILRAIIVAFGRPTQRQRKVRVGVLNTIIVGFESPEQSCREIEAVLRTIKSDTKEVNGLVNCWFVSRRHHGITDYGVCLTRLLKPITLTTEYLFNQDHQLGD